MSGAIGQVGGRLANAAISHAEQSRYSGSLLEDVPEDDLSQYVDAQLSKFAADNEQQWPPEDGVTTKYPEDGVTTEQSGFHPMKACRAQTEEESVRESVRRLCHPSTGRARGVFRPDDEADVTRAMTQIWGMSDTDKMRKIIKSKLPECSGRQANAIIRESLNNLPALTLGAVFLGSVSSPRIDCHLHYPPVFNKLTERLNEQLNQRIRHELQRTCPEKHYDFQEVRNDVCTLVAIWGTVPSRMKASLVEKRYSSDEIAVLLKIIKEHRTSYPRLFSDARLLRMIKSAHSLQPPVVKPKNLAWVLGGLVHNTLEPTVRRLRSMMGTLRGKLPKRLHHSQVTTCVNRCLNSDKGVTQATEPCGLAHVSVLGVERSCEKLVRQQRRDVISCIQWLSIQVLNLTRPLLGRWGRE